MFDNYNIDNKASSAIKQETNKAVTKILMQSIYSYLSVRRFLFF